jgi:hypothetical protein
MKYKALSKENEELGSVYQQQITGSKQGRKQARFLVGSPKAGNGD